MGFLYPPTFASPQGFQTIPLGNANDVLTMDPATLRPKFLPGGGGGGGPPLPGVAFDSPAPGSHNDYAPPGLAVGHQKLLEQLTGDTTFTGLNPDGLTDGFMVSLTNYSGGFTLTLTFSDPASATANQFFGQGGVGNSLDIPPGATQLLVYFDDGRGNAGWLLI